MTRTEQIRVRVDTPTRRQLEALAAKQQRTLSNMVRVLLSEALSNYNDESPHPTAEPVQEVTR